MKAVDNGYAARRTFSRRLGAGYPQGYSHMKMAQKMINKSETRAGRPQTTDYLYWEKNGWLGGKKPWKG
ncbi:MAG: hypothetical protein FWF69_10335 [Firmicutes bacterium]|nr:hypothetical protein [Bacillota bacterium]